MGGLASVWAMGGSLEPLHSRRGGKGGGDWMKYEGGAGFPGGPDMRWEEKRGQEQRWKSRQLRRIAVYSPKNS